MDCIPDIYLGIMNVNLLNMMSYGTLRSLDKNNYSDHICVFICVPPWSSVVTMQCNEPHYHLKSVIFQVLFVFCNHRCLITFVMIFFSVFFNRNRVCVCVYVCVFVCIFPVRRSFSLIYGVYHLSPEILISGSNLDFVKGLKSFVCFFQFLFWTFISSWIWTGNKCWKHIFTSFATFTLSMNDARRANKHRGTMHGRLLFPKIVYSLL